MPTPQLSLSSSFDMNATLKEVRRYFALEATRLYSPQRKSATRVRLAAFHDVSQARGHVLWEVEANHRPRKVDVAVYLFLKLARLFGATTSLNSNESGKTNGSGRFYPHLYAGGGHFSIMRIICDAQPGFRVKENCSDHRNHLRQAMSVIRVDTLFRPSKNNLGRKEAIEAITRMHDVAPPELSSEIDRFELMAVLWMLLHIADCHYWRCNLAELQYFNDGAKEAA